MTTSHAHTNADAGRPRHHSSRGARRLLAPLAFALLVGAAFVSLDIPGETRFRQAVQNAGHGLAFAALAFVTLLSLGARSEPRLGPLAALAGGVALALFVLGVGIELAQYLTGRGASGEDLLMNLGGIIAGTTLAVTTCRAAAIRSLPVRTGRIAAAMIGTLALLWCLRLPIAISVIDAFAPGPPTLASFDRPFALARLASGSTPAKLALIEADARWPDNATVALEATFPPGLWPGFRLVEPSPDWRGYRALTMNVVNPELDPVKLHVRVDQRAEGEDIFWRVAGRTLGPGRHTLRIELASMRPDVVLEARRADHEPFAEVSQVLVFLSGNRERVTLLFDDVMLVP